MKGTIMRKTGILFSLCCAVALCLALVGCGGAESGNDTAKAAFTGTWDLTGITQDGEVTSSEDIAMLSSLGLEVYLTLNEDGTSQLVLFGEPMEGTWTAESETAGTVVLQGENTAMTIEGDTLTMTENDSSLTFKKGEAHSDASTAATDGASANNGATTDDGSANDESSADQPTDEGEGSEGSEG